MADKNIKNKEELDSEEKTTEAVSEEDKPSTENTSSEEKTTETTSSNNEETTETINMEEVEDLRNFKRTSMITDTAREMNLDTSRMELINKLIEGVDHNSELEAIGKSLEKVIALVPDLQKSTDSNLIPTDEEKIDDESNNEEKNKNKSTGSSFTEGTLVD